MMKTSIFIKLFFTYLLSAFTAFLVFVGISYILFSNDLKQDFQRLLEEKKAQVEKTLELAYENFENKDEIISTLAYSTDADHRSIFLFNSNGEVTYSFSSYEDLSFLKDEFSEEIMSDNVQIHFIKHAGKPIFFITAPLSDNYEERFQLIALHGYEQIASGIKAIFILAGIITMIVTTLFLYLISRKITAPLRHINRVALSYANGDFSKRISVKNQDEIGQLGQTLNHMAIELESLDNTRKEFVANVSHDMRSPLTSINGFVVAMIDGTIPPAQQQRYLHLIKDETSRLIKLVNDLLDIASMEARQVCVTPMNYNVSEQLRKLIARKEPEILKDQLEILLTSNKEKDSFVYADPNRIDQVLSNLIDNAINFSPKCGTINVQIDDWDESVKITITDEGPGMEEEELKYIWDRFFKADKARSKKVGTGIGLSIVKHIIDLHGAKIAVESRKGQGTSFIVTLPTVNTMLEDK